MWNSAALANADDWLHVGPLFDHFPLTLEPGTRTEAVGPLFYFERGESHRTWAFPPLLSRTWDPGTDFEEIDFAFPVMTYHRYGSEFRWQLMQVLSFAGGRNQQDEHARRFTIYPIFFLQRSAESNRNYTAFVPFYGHLQGRLFRDEIFFVMFPIYGQSRKADVVTDNYLYPFFHIRHGEALSGWQVWPLTGHEHKEPTTRTNGFGEVEIVGGHDSRFVLWPIFAERTDGIGTTNLQQELAVLPLYASVRSPQRDSTTILWPFFSHITDRARKYREWQAPWPLVEFARGEGKRTSRIFPFFSQSTNANLESDWYLWPAYKYNRVHAETVDRHRMRLFLFFYSDTVQKNLETGHYQRRSDLFPFFTRKRDYDGSIRLQIFAPVEPILPSSTSIERLYSPLWSVWRSEKNATTGAASQSLLWNLYRRETTPASKKCSLLFGLFQYQSGSDGKRLRMFYIPLVNTRGRATGNAR